MKCIFSLFLAIVAGTALHAQKPVKVNQAKTFNNNVNTAINTGQPVVKYNKDTALQAYEREIKVVLANASGRNSNVAAARGVYEKYKGKINISAPAEPVVEPEQNQTSISRVEYNNKNDQFLKKFSRLDRLQGTVYPAYSAKWSQHWKHYNSQGELPPLREFNTDLSKGRIGFTADIRDKDNGINKAFVGFRQRIRIPNDPEVIAASFTFHYSFFYTGWENPGARFGLELRVHAPEDFTSANYNELPKRSDFYQGTYNWKMVDELYPWTYISPDMGLQELHASIDSSFTLVGYVRPGTAFDLMLGAGYVYPSTMSNMCGYHYGEFILKSIEIKFLKTLETGNNGGVRQ